MRMWGEDEVVWSGGRGKGRARSAKTGILAERKSDDKRIFYILEGLIEQSVCEVRGEFSSGWPFEYICEGTTKSIMLRLCMSEEFLPSSDGTRDITIYSW